MDKNSPICDSCGNTKTLLLNSYADCDCKSSVENKQLFSWRKSWEDWQKNNNSDVTRWRNSLFQSLIALHKGRWDYAWWHEHLYQWSRCRNESLEYALEHFLNNPIE